MLKWKRARWTKSAIGETRFATAPSPRRSFPSCRWLRPVPSAAYSTWGKLVVIGVALRRSSCRF
jgi:hypothetical protein